MGIYNVKVYLGKGRTTKTKMTMNGTDPAVGKEREDTIQSTTFTSGLSVCVCAVEERWS